MKRLDNLLVVIALFCSIFFTACTVDNIDNPSVTPEVKPIENDMMDTSVKPGEDFFRYCNGKWIDALTVDLGAEKPDKQYYGFFPTEIQKTNAIQIYPVFLSEPFISSNGLSVEMFAYSMIYAHEMTHGFDSKGALYDKYGSVGSIIAEADKAEFSKRIQLLDDCYNSMETLPGSKVMCDGKTTEQENIADLGGFLIAYDACKAWLEEEKGIKGEDLKQQMRQFCIAYGNLWRSKYTLEYVKESIGYDGHSYTRERVNGVVRNSDAWYELFDIKLGDALYLAPEKRAYIW